MTVSESYRILMEEESDKLIDQEKTIAAALKDVEENGIVFLDEIDKILCVFTASRGRRQP